MADYSSENQKPETIIYKIPEKELNESCKNMKDDALKECLEFINQIKKEQSGKPLVVAPSEELKVK